MESSTNYYLWNMKTILCPVDFSDTSKYALDYAADLAIHLNSSIVLLHVYELPVLYGDAPFLAMQQLNDELKVAAENNLEMTEKNLRKRFEKMDLHTRLQNGIPSAEIQKCAGEVNADLIVMGTKGMTAMERLLIGSTAERVFHHSSIPVLCIPHNVQYQMIRQIIFATDLEEDNLTAAGDLITFADKLNASVKFLYVDTGKDNHPSTADLLNKISQQIQYDKLTVDVAKDDSVSKGLQHYVTDHPADVLAMYTHQRSFPRSLVAQSVTNQTLHHLDVPLLVLPPVKQ
jgi:nucleotide-binding universal stress UspA family protein